MTIIGVGQAEFRVGDLAYNRAAIRSLLDEAGEKRVEILVLPELASSGYVFDGSQEAKACAEPVPDGPVSRMLADWSRPGRLVCAGICEQSGDGLYNAAPVFADGRCLGVYRKAHLFMKEGEIFQPGQEPPPVYPYKDFRIGVMICFDWAFPEMARVLALAGAQLILHPSNLVLPYCMQAMLTRSIENRVFTATANRTGLERGTLFSGSSQITSPQGERLVQAGQEFSGVITADVDLTQADNKWITPYNHVFQDRRPELYQVCKVNESI